MTLAQADQILGKGGDSSPRAVVDQKSPGQIELSDLRDFVKVNGKQQDSKSFLRKIARNP